MRARRGGRSGESGKSRTKRGARSTKAADAEATSALHESDRRRENSARDDEANQRDAVAHERDVLQRESRNLGLISLYDVVIRIGWIFKTESVIMPAFLDAVAGAGWLRGLLPVVNRFGQSVPPTVYSPRLRRAGWKKHSLARWTAAMAATFLALAGVWWFVGSQPPAWMAWFFLLMYGAFSCCHGVNQLSYGTLQGKLIHAQRRGRLMAISLPLGSVLAIAFACWLLGGWLEHPATGFAYIFAFTGVCFALGAVVALAIDEPRDPSHRGPRERSRHPFHAAWQVLRTDANFRRLAAVVMLAAVANILFPHYQALAREQLDLGGANLMLWVVVQNATVGVFGLAMGRVVDRSGERLALRLSILGMSLAPLMALVMAQLGPDIGGRWFWTIFIPLGLTPVSLKTMVGYTLEIAPTAEHPRYLSTLSLCLAVPFCLSPLVGWLVDATSFELVFLVGAALIVLSGLLTFRLAEPRLEHHAPLLFPAGELRSSS